jgi:hypothetical protein
MQDLNDELVMELDARQNPQIVTASSLRAALLLQCLSQRIRGKLS